MCDNNPFKIVDRINPKYVILILSQPLPMLEPDEVKVSCPVLRGLGAGNSPRLPGVQKAAPLIKEFADNLHMRGVAWIELLKRFLTNLLNKMD